MQRGMNYVGGGSLWLKNKRKCSLNYVWRDLGKKWFSQYDGWLSHDPRAVSGFSRRECDSIHYATPVFWKTASITLFGVLNYGSKNYAICRYNRRMREMRSDSADQARWRNYAVGERVAAIRWLVTGGVILKWMVGLGGVGSLSWMGTIISIRSTA